MAKPVKADKKNPNTPTDFLFSKDFTLAARQVRKITGFSYRKINHWGAKGILSSLPRAKSSHWYWRKFRGVDVINLIILQRLQDEYGVPLGKLKWLSDELQDPCLIKDAIAEIAKGKEVFLYTNLHWVTVFAKEHIVSTILESQGILNRITNKPHKYPQIILLIYLNHLIKKVLNALMDY